MATCKFCGGDGGKHVTRDETCSKCQGLGRAPNQDRYIYCSRCFGRGTIIATTWEYCSCRQGIDKQDGGKQKAGCFPAGTMVTTLFGQKEISRLSTGDKVTVYDAKKVAFTEKEVLKVLTYKKRRSLRITLANGIRLHLTPNHNIFVDGLWMRASGLKKGVPVSTVKAVTSGHVLENMMVTSIDDAGYCDVVYNPVIADSFSLIANGIITHNFDQFKQAKMIYWNLYESLLHTLNVQRHTQPTPCSSD